MQRNGVLMGIIDKLSSIDTSTVSVNNEYMELQLCKEDYEYLKKLEELYSKTYDFQRKWVDDSLKFIMENATEEEKYDFKYKSTGYETYRESIVGWMLDYYNIKSYLYSCNFVFLVNVFRYFERKYKMDSHNILISKDISGDKGKDKVTLKSVLEYIRVNYNFIPPSQ